MKRLLVCALFAVSGSVFATQGGEHNNTDCNGKGNANSPCAGQGGQAGQGGNGGSGGAGGNGGNANNSTKVVNSNVNRTFAVGLGGSSDQSQEQGQSQNATGGSATSTASTSSTANSTASNAGNTQSVSISSPAAPEKVTIKTTGEAPTVISNTTANCRSAVGASAGWLGGAFGFGTTVADETCQLIELSKRLEQLGLKDPAIALMCQDERAAKAMGSLCN